MEADGYLSKWKICGIIYNNGRKRARGPKRVERRNANVNACILALDVGTSAVKASLVSTELKVIAEAAQRYPTQTPAPHCAEQDARDWWGAAVTAAKRLFEIHPEGANEVCAIGVSAHMLGLLPVDAQGEPLMPSLIHADTRAMAELAQVERTIGLERIYELTGNTLSPAVPLCKAMWLKANRPEIYARTARFLQAKDYLNFRLTGNLDTTDYSDASHGMLIDIRKREYLAEVFAELGLDASRFPALHRSTEVIGHLTAKAAAQLGLKRGIPVAAGGGDGACANVGAGIARTGDVYCSLGTTGWIACSMDAPYLDPQRRVFNILSLDGEHSGVFGTVESVGRSIDWAQKIYAPEGIGAMNALAEEIPAGSDGLVFLPYLQGERSPIFDPLARGVFFGLQPNHDRRYFARAVFEGVSYALAGIVDIMRERMPVEEMRIIGGGAKSALWRQILADAGRVRVWGVDASAAAATSLGAAAAAGVAVGAFNSLDEAVGRVGVTDCVDPNPENLEVYAERMRLYQMLYPLLKPAFHERFSK